MSNDNNENNNLLFDKAVEAMKKAEPTDVEMNAAAERVWAKIMEARQCGEIQAGTGKIQAGTGKIQAGTGKIQAGLVTELQHAGAAPVLRAPEDYEALFPAYLAGSLDASMRELLEAHLREDLRMRQAWQQYKAAQTAADASAEPASARLLSFGQRRNAYRAGSPATVPFAQFRWAALAAMLALAAGLSWYGWNAWGPGQRGPQAVVQLTQGGLIAFEGADTRPLAEGANIPPHQQIRVTDGGRAILQLRDGSTMELRAGTSLHLHSFGNNLTVHLHGGDVIVEAAKRSQGKLFVESRDMRVAVTGTVFAVGAGVKGSRVGVVEGSVLVAQAGRKLALRPGQQYASADELTPLSVEQQISWSGNLQKHLALLRSLTILEAELSLLQLPSLRYSSSLMGRLPAETMLYASVPNLQDPIRQAREVLSSRLQQDAVLREWLNAHQNSLPVDTLLAEMEGFSAFVGDEVLLLSIRGPDGKPSPPALVAELRKEGFGDYLRQRVQLLATNNTPDERPAEKLNIYSTLATAAVAAGDQGLQVLAGDGILVLSPDVHALRQLAVAFSATGDEGFRGSPLGARVQAVYQRGAGFFLAADISAFLSRMPSSGDDAATFTGVRNLQFLEVEQREVNGVGDLRSTFRFSEDRSGMASWLAAPGAMRALEFVTPSAVAVSAAAVKDPVAMLDDLLAVMSARKDGASPIDELESRLNLRIRDDLAMPLGNEIAIALDGAVLPVPSWKVVVQVDDAARLRSTIERLVEAYNREAAVQAKPVASLTADAVDGVVYHTLRLPVAGMWSTAHFAFAGGYLIAAPERGLVRAALQTQASGASILNQPAFRERMPVGATTGFSAVFFQQAGASLSGIANELGNLASQDPEAAAAVQQAIRELKPSMVTAYASPREITIASRDNLISLSGAPMLRMGALLRAFGEGKTGND